MIVSDSSSLRSPSQRNGRHLGAIALILVSGGLIAAYYFTGFFGSDDLSYVSGAYGLSGGTPPYAIVGGARYTITIPLRMLLEVAGHDPQRAVVWFSVVYLLLSIVVYLLVSRLYGRGAGICSALLVIANPILFLYSGAILPDNVLALFLASSVLLFACWLRACESSSATRNKAMLFVAAALAGCCYATKEASTLFFVPLAVYGILALRRNSGQQALLILAVAFSGFLSVVCMDALLSGYIYGDPFIRLNAAENMDVIGSAERIMSKQGIYPWQRVANLWGQFSRTWPTIPVYFIAILYLVIMHRRIGSFMASTDGIVAVTAVWIFTFLTFGSVSIKQYVGIPLQERYYAPGAVLLCICLGRAVADLAMRASTRGQGVLWGAVAALMMIQVAWPASLAGNIYRAREYRATVAAVKNASRLYPDVPVFVDSYLAFRVLGYGSVKGAGVLRDNDNPSRFIYIYSLSRKKRPDKHLSRILRCEKAGRGAESITSMIVDDEWRTRFDAVEAELGFVNRADREPSPKVRALMVKASRACRV